jgi:hypothetical protein
MGYGTTVTTNLSFDDAVARTGRLCRSRASACRRRSMCSSGDTTLVQALDPQVMVSLPGRPELQPVADEAAARLNAALSAVAGA